MLKLFPSVQKLNMSQLSSVYDERIALDWLQQSSLQDANSRYIVALQDFYGYVQDFLADADTLIAVWEVAETYVSALRLEPYEDGLLLTGLETGAAHRRKGFAACLVNGVIAHLKKFGPFKLYSHVDKGNRASISLHIACGFQRVTEYAVYLDGVIRSTSCTFLYEYF